MSQAFLKAARLGNLNKLKNFYARGGDINFQDEQGYSALAYAVKAGHHECVKYLLSLDHIKTDLEVEDEVDFDDDQFNGLPLHLAAFQGDLVCIRLLVERSPRDLDRVAWQGYSALHAAVLKGQTEAFKLLLRLGADDEVATEEDVDKIGFLEGMNTLQLIAHMGRENFPDSSFEAMWQMLIRKKLRNNEPLTGNIIEDSDDTLSDDSDDQYDDLFNDTEDELTREAMINYYRYDSNDLDPDEEYIDTIIRRSRRDDFEKSHDYEMRRNKGQEEEGEDFTDTDSEDEKDYQQNPNDLIENSLNRFQVPVQGACLVLHARGHHFYQIKNKETKALTGTHNEIKSNVYYSHGNKLVSGIYSTDAYKRANVKFTVPLSAENTQKLATAAQDTRAVLDKLAQEKNVTPILGRSANASGREIFESRLIELVQRYVNSYRTLNEDIQRAQILTPDDLKNERTKAKQAILQLIKDNPFVSTSEDISVALNYAFAIINYDKQETHQPRLDIVLKPEYQTDGDLRHPYLGSIFITLHTETELLNDSLNIAQLFQENKIDPIKGPGTHETSGYIRALERIFLGEISKNHVCVAKVVRVPNLYYPYRPFLMSKYGLSQEQYDKFKADLLSSGTRNYKGEMRNAKNFYRIQQKIIEHVIAFQKNNFIEKIKIWADSKNIVVGSLNDQGAFSPTLDINAQEKISASSATRKIAEQASSSKTLTTSYTGTKRKAQTGQTNTNTKLKI